MANLDTGLMNTGIDPAILEAVQEMSGVQALRFQDTLLKSNPIGAMLMSKAGSFMGAFKRFPITTGTIGLGQYDSLSIAQAQTYFEGSHVVDGETKVAEMGDFLTWGTTTPAQFARQLGMYRYEIDMVKGGQIALSEVISRKYKDYRIVFDTSIVNDMYYGNGVVAPTDKIQLEGLFSKLLVPTETYMGIDPATYTFWVPRSWDLTTDTVYGYDSTNFDSMADALDTSSTSDTHVPGMPPILDLLEWCISQFRPRKPKVILVHRKMYLLIRKALQAYFGAAWQASTPVNDPILKDFTTLSINGVPIVQDDGYIGQSINIFPEASVAFINTDTLHLDVANGHKLAVSPWEESKTQWFTMTQDFTASFAMWTDCRLDHGIVKFPSTLLDEIGE